MALQYIVIAYIEPTHYISICNGEVFEILDKDIGSAMFFKEQLHDRYPSYRILLLLDNSMQYGMEQILQPFQSEEEAIQLANELIRFNRPLTPTHFDVVTEQDKQQLKTTIMSKVELTPDAAKIKAQLQADSLVGHIMGTIHFGFYGTARVFDFFADQTAKREAKIRTHILGDLLADGVTIEDIASDRKDSSQRKCDKIAAVPEKVGDHIRSIKEKYKNRKPVKVVSMNKSAS